MEKQPLALKIARFILVSGISCSTGIILYGLIRYKRVFFWGFEWKITPYDGAIAFYLFPLLVVLFLLITLKLPDASQINVALEVEKKNPFWIHYLEQNYSWGFRSKQHEINQSLINFHHLQETRNAQEYSPQPTPTLLQKGYDKGKKFLKLLRNILLLRHLRYTIHLRFISPNTKPSPMNQYFYYCGNSCTFDFDLFRQILTLVRDTTHSWNGKLYFVDLPGYGKNPTYDERDQAISIVQGLDIPLIDLSEVFQSQEDPLEMFPYRLPGHYSPKGYQVVAETILKRLREDQVLED